MILVAYSRYQQSKRHYSKNCRFHQSVWKVTCIRQLSMVASWSCRAAVSNKTHTKTTKKKSREGNVNVYHLSLKSSLCVLALVSWAESGTSSTLGLAYVNPFRHVILGECRCGVYIAAPYFNLIHLTSYNWHGVAQLRNYMLKRHLPYSNPVQPWGLKSIMLGKKLRSQTNSKSNSPEVQSITSLKTSKKTDQHSTIREDFSILKCICYIDKDYGD